MHLGAGAFTSDIRARATCRSCIGSVETGSGIGWSSDRLSSECGGKVLEGNQTQGRNGLRMSEMANEATDSLVEKRLEGAFIRWKVSSENGCLVGVTESRRRVEGAGNSRGRDAKKLHLVVAVFGHAMWGPCAVFGLRVPSSSNADWKGVGGNLEA